MPKLLRFIVLSLKTNPIVPPMFFVFVKSGFERMLVLPGISKMAFLDNAENPTFYRLQF